MRQRERWMIILASILLLVLSSLMITSLQVLQSREWWRYVVAIVGLGFVIPVLGALGGRILMTATQKRSFFASLVVRGLTLALLLCTWGVVASFVLMPTVGDATRRLTGFLRVETLIGLVILGVIASLPFTRLGHRTTRGRGDEHE